LAKKSKKADPQLDYGFAKARQSLPTPPRDYYTIFVRWEEKNFQFFSSHLTKIVWKREGLPQKLRMTHRGWPGKSQGRSGAEK